MEEGVEDIEEHDGLEATFANWQYNRVINISF